MLQASGSGHEALSKAKLDPFMSAQWRFQVTIEATTPWLENVSDSDYAGGSRTTIAG